MFDVPWELREPRVKQLEDEPEGAGELHLGITAMAGGGDEERGYWAKLLLPLPLKEHLSGFP